MIEELKTKNIQEIREDFPILKRKINGRPLIYFDNASSSQKPIQVINALNNFYSNYNSNIHRSIHTLGEEATEAYEKVREKVASFVNAMPEEIIFTRNTTESLNLVMRGWAWENLKKGDEIILTRMEHHSNIVPWQYLQRRGIKLKFVDLNQDGTLKLEDFDKLVSKKTRIISVTHVSNVLGTINPVEEISGIAHDVGSIFVLDAAQSVPHMPVDVKKIDPDFMAFSAHKMLGPTGIGVLQAKKEILEETDPMLYESDMIKEVGLTEPIFLEAPWKFETGTPNIAGTIAFGEAIEYLERIGMK